MNLLKMLVAATVLLGAGCTDLFNSWNKKQPPGVSVSGGHAENLTVSWSAPSAPAPSPSPSPSDPPSPTVVSYGVYRGGNLVTSTTQTTWIDFTAEPATLYTYQVRAAYSDGTTTDLSDGASGWYVPANDLVFGQHPGTVSVPGSSVTVDGWFETLLVKGWTYHFNAPASADFFVCDHDSPWEQTAMGTGSSLTWVADRTGTVWIRTVTAQPLDAWYQ